MHNVTTATSYSFDRFIQQRAALNDLQNPFLQAVLQRFVGDDWAMLKTSIEPFSERLATRWRKLAEEIARPANHPRLLHYDAYNHRIDRIVRPLEAVQLTEEVFGEKLFSKHQHSAIGVIKKYLLHTNGELGITCPVACTDGLVALLDTFYDELSDEVKRIHQHVTEGIDGHIGLGAQYMSEMQGGSNIPANVLRAVQDGAHMRLYGNKFFCSAVHADYSVVTAKVEQTGEVAVFIVPTWLPGDKQKEKLNHFRINRLKWKLGTTELPSGEIDYDGAIAYPVGPQNRGVALAVSIVLTRSRLDIGFASGAFLMRAAREAKLYASFREVFDRTIDAFPMAAAQLEDLEQAAKRTVTTAFHIYKQFSKLEQFSALDAFAVRELVLLQKIYTTKEAVDQLRMAISLFGGHGAIEDFSSIPRLFRDSLVNELWEGPRNVLLAQIYRDIAKSKWPLEEVLQAMFPHLTVHDGAYYATALQDIMATDLVGVPNAENRVAARNWERIWEELFIGYQEHIVAQYEDLPILPS